MFPCAVRESWEGFSEFHRVADNSEGFFSESRSIFGEFKTFWPEILATLEPRENARRSKTISPLFQVLRFFWEINNSFEVRQRFELLLFIIMWINSQNNYVNGKNSSLKNKKRCIILISAWWLHFECRKMLNETIKYMCIYIYTYI